MDEEIYYVEEIRDREIRRGKFYYLIKWQGYGERDNTWEPSENLDKSLIAAYESKQLHKQSENDSPDDDWFPERERIKTYKQPEKEQKREKDHYETSKEKTTKTVNEKIRKRSKSMTLSEGEWFPTPKKANINEHPQKEHKKYDAEKNKDRAKSFKEKTDKPKDIQKYEKNSKEQMKGGDSKSSTSKGSTNDKNKNIVKKKLRPKCVLGFTDIDEKLHCVIEFYGGSIKKVPHKIAREKFPQTLIDYYEMNIEFTNPK